MHAAGSKIARWSKQAGADTCGYAMQAAGSAEGDDQKAWGNLFLVFWPQKWGLQFVRHSARMTSWKWHLHTIAKGVAMKLWGKSKIIQRLCHCKLKLILCGHGASSVVKRHTQLGSQLPNAILLPSYPCGHFYTINQKKARVVMKFDVSWFPSC